jgi:hypothetical protein
LLIATNASSNNSTASAVATDLEIQCHSFLRHGLASSTHKTYASAQRSFLQFCESENRLNSNGSPLPSGEWTLCLFATWLANNLKPASIKVYLSAVRALHIEHGYLDPLVGCLRLQRVVKGIKRCKGSSQNKRLPIAPDIFSAICRCLDFAVYHCTSGPLVVWLILVSCDHPHGTSYSPSLHLSHQDVAFDRRVDPSCLQVFIKVSKGPDTPDAIRQRDFSIFTDR